MGMYDSVMVPCPKCGERSEFQSKSGACTLAVFSLECAPDVVLFGLGDSTEHCAKCGTHFTVEISGAYLRRTLVARSVVWGEKES